MKTKKQKVEDILDVLDFDPDINICLKYEDGSLMHRIVFGKPKKGEYKLRWDGVIEFSSKDIGQDIRYICWDVV